jgi:hypothetical protein
MNYREQRVSQSQCLISFIIEIQILKKLVVYEFYEAYAQYKLLFSIFAHTKDIYHYNKGFHGTLPWEYV